MAHKGSVADERKVENGHRHPLWIPDRHAWVVAMIDSDVKAMEVQHRKSSRSSVILEILLRHYEAELEKAVEKKSADGCTDSKP